MKVCVVGLGSIGGLIGYRLAAAGHEVSALARGATLAAVRRDGLRLETSDGQVMAPVRIAVSDDPADLVGAETVILAVKATALTAVGAAVNTIGGDVVSATNGIPWWFFADRPGQAAPIRLDSVVDPGIGVDRVIGSVIHLSASVPTPGVVRHASGDRIILGEPLGGVSARVDAVADALVSAGFTVETSDHIQAEVWFKLWGNMTSNPISVLTGTTMDRFVNDPLVEAFMVRCMREAVAVGEAIGIRLEATPESRMQVGRGIGPIKTSMLQDVEAGRPVELDAILASVVELGDILGIPTPDLDTLLGLARVRVGR